MQISSRFTIAVHIFVCIVTFGKDYKVNQRIPRWKCECKSGRDPEYFVSVEKSRIGECSSGNRGRVVGKANGRYHISGYLQCLGVRGAAGTVSFS